MSETHANLKALNLKRTDTSSFTKDGLDKRQSFRLGSLGDRRVLQSKLFLTEWFGNFKKHHDEGCNAN